MLINEFEHINQGKYLVCKSKHYNRSCPCMFQVRWQRTTFDASGNEVTTIHISTDMDSEDVNKWSIEKPTPYSWRLRVKALQVNIVYMGIAMRDRGLRHCR